MDLSKIFKQPISFYTSRINPIKDYFDICKEVVSTMTGKDVPVELIKKYVKDNGLFDNPKVTFYERDLKGIRNETSTNLLNYISYVRKTNDIIAPSFTVYFAKSKKKSLHAEFINVNVRERSRHKKLAFKYKMEKNFEKFNYHNVIQKVKKIFNNSLSGAYASMGTILNNPSAHYTLTSMTRVISGIGNAIAESLISGNRHYRTPDIAFNHIATIVSILDEEAFREIVIKYNLYIPEASDVMDAILKSTRKYWRSTTKEAVIYEYLQKLNGLQRAYILYQNDLFHLRKFNSRLMRTIVDDMVDFEIIDLDLEECNDIMKNAEEWVLNLSIHINAPLIKGKDSAKFTLEDKRALASYILSIGKVLYKYEDIFKILVVTEVFPASIAYIKDMVREAIVLSDTDSTCATYEDWVFWYFGKHTFSHKAVSITAAVMTIVTQSTDHYIKTFAGNMNIKPEDAEVLAMKNEFFWSVFVNTNVSKHYFANVDIQEGNVYDDIDPIKNLEKKGVNLIVPNVYGPIRELSEKMMIEIMSLSRTNKKVILDKFVNYTLEAERMILNKILEGSPDVLKLEKIKEHKSYKKGPKESPYVYYLLWEEVFSEKYTKSPPPQYMAVKIPTITTTKGSMKLFIDNIPDIHFADKMRRFLHDVKKEYITTYRLPLVIIYNNGIPKEILPIIDFKRVIKDNVKVLYMILETLDYYVKEDTILLEEIEDLDMTTLLD